MLNKLLSVLKLASELKSVTFAVSAKSAFDKEFTDVGRCGRRLFILPLTIIIIIIIIHRAVSRAISAR